MISSVRTTPRPRNARSNSSAINKPSNAETSTTTDDQDDGVERHRPELAVLDDGDVVVQADESPRTRDEPGSTTASSSRA